MENTQILLQSEWGKERLVVGGLHGQNFNDLPPIYDHVMKS